MTKLVVFVLAAVLLAPTTATAHSLLPQEQNGSTPGTFWKAETSAQELVLEGPDSETELSASPQMGTTSPQVLPVLADESFQEVDISFYYCQNDTPSNRGDGGTYCILHGAPMKPGDAACPGYWRWRSFTIVNDPLGLTYTCVDTGGGLGPTQVDIWFYLSSDGWYWQFLVGQKGWIIWQP